MKQGPTSLGMFLRVSDDAREEFKRNPGRKLISETLQK